MAAGGFKAAAGHGRLAALASAIAYGLVVPFAGLAYSGGAVPSAVIEIRLLAGLVGTAAAVVGLRRAWFVARHTWWPTGFVALAWLVVSVGYMASFYFIPVSLAVLIFFTFPVQVALVEPLLERRWPSALPLAAVLTAFVGLAFALGPDLGGLDWRGCALAFAAAVGIATTFLVSRHLVVAQDMFTFSFNLHLLCAGAVVLYILYAGGMNLPTTLLAGGALAVMGGLYVCAVLLQFAAIRAIGPGRAAIVFNAEPVISLLGAALLLGEQLGPGQLLGAGLVVAGVLLSTLERHGEPVDPLG